MRFSLTKWGGYQGSRFGDRKQQFGLYIINIIVMWPSKKSCQKDRWLYEPGIQAYGID
jgi:hypothetical protein